MLNTNISSIYERVTQLETVAVKNIVQVLKERVAMLENIGVASEIRINGIPAYENENLQDIFFSICSTIGITPPSIMNIFRIKLKNFIPPKDGAIIVQLVSPNIRSYMMRAAAKYRRKNTVLRLHNIGFQLNEPIYKYIYENLTKNNNIIMRAASKYKRDNLIATALSQQGKVFVKRLQQDTPIRMCSLTMLDEFVSGFRDMGQRSCN